jgi:hypothetical protein
MIATSSNRASVAGLTVMLIDLTLMLSCGGSDLSMIMADLAVQPLIISWSVVIARELTRRS